VSFLNQGEERLMQVFEVGALRVVRALELEFPLGPAILPVGRDPAKLVSQCSWAHPHFVTPGGDVVFALCALGVVSDGQRIVIDPCCSFDLRRENPDIRERAAALLDDALPAAGFAPDDVDLVVNTHLDGVGWNVRPGPDGWVPAFPNARNVWTQLELDRVARDASADDPGDHASLAPLREAGRIDGVSASHRVTEEIVFRPSPGHTEGNVDIWIESEGECAVVVGDHVLNPMQCADPDWTGLDMQSDASPGIRRALLEECEARDALMIGPHFGSPGAGRVRREGDVWRLDPEPAA
jgi:glyoxylase-like metal-dependent hydrolase (beta-lactamase superfamily II)